MVNCILSDLKSSHWIYSGNNHLDREMNKSTRVLQINPAYEDDEKPPSFFRPKQIADQTEESDHSSHDHCNPLYEVLNTGKAKLAQGSSRTLFILVIIVCLLSLLALLLTLLMLVGKIGSSNEGQCTG